jgi:HAD superfamily hydrolase (TIGR01509 family)
VAIVSSSKNARQVLTAAGLIDRFELIVDGTVAASEGLPGKPAPDTYVFAARSLGVEPARAVVVEDATSGVASGRAGGFGLVVGVDRGAGRETLLDAGADIVVSDLAELTINETGGNAR